MTPKLSTQTHVGNHKAAPSIKKRMSKLLCAGVALFVISAGVVQAADDSDGGFLPNARIVSTLPPNGDLNLYGVAFVPLLFQSGSGPLQPGDILVSNFNNSSNLQGTGTTIVRIPVSGPVSLFFTAPTPAPGAPGFGLSTALAVLRKGFVIVGNVPSKDGTAATVSRGSLLVIDDTGQLVNTITDSTINGPWDMTMMDRGDQATAFVSNVLSGTVVRLELNVATNGVAVANKTVIASGYRTSRRSSCLRSWPDRFGI